MTFKTTQKVIKIGTSAGVTIPAKELRRAGVEPGDEISLSFEPVHKVDADKIELVETTQRLIDRHKKALKSLANR